MTVPLDEIHGEDVPLSSNGQYDPEREARERAQRIRIIESDTLASLIERPKTQIAREYEKKTAAMLNALMRGTASSPNTVADAAAIIVYGPSLASAAGELAEADEAARKMIDMIATPSNPWIMLAMAGLPLAAQLFRNHESEVVKPVRKITKDIKIPLFKNKTLHLRIPLRLAMPKHFRNQTIPAKVLSQSVFENADVVKALRKRGIDVAWPGL